MRFFADPPRRIAEAALALRASDEKYGDDMDRAVVATRLEEVLVKEGGVWASGAYEQGVAAGKLLGEARGRAIALIRILDARGLAVPDEARESILALLDSARLEACLARAII